MKKIQIVIWNLGCGGAEKVIVDILDNLDYSKYDVELLLIEKRGVYLDKVNKRVKIKYIFNGKVFKNNKIENIYALVKRTIIKLFGSILMSRYSNKKLDLQIAFLEGLTTLLVSKNNNKNVKKIAWIHTDLTKLRTMSKEKEEKCYSKYKKVVCVSNDSLKKLLDLYPNLKERSTVIYNLLDDEKIRNLAKEKIIKKSNTTLVVGVGRLISIKRFDLLIKAHKILLQKGIENRLLILGEGEELQNLKNLSINLGVESSVEFVGFVENPYPYIANSDVFTVTSDYEGFSMVTAEALILEKAIVSTRCVGPIELLDNGECGVLVDCNNLNEIVVALEQIIADVDYKKKLENKAKIKSKQFDKKLIIKEIDDLISNI